jgi:hypothetical protein
MPVKVIYPVPQDNWRTFEPFVLRFVETLRKYDPGYPYELIAVLNNGTQSKHLEDLFAGLPVRFWVYNGTGWNMGSAQAAMAICFDDDFIVSMSSRCYFHREGWLAKMMAARAAHGPGIYGTGSFEAKRHIRACAFGIDAKLFRAVPFQVLVPDDGHRLEYKNHCLTDFVEANGGVAKQVTFVGVQNSKDWRKPENIYRKGDQSNVLVMDKWTEDYFNCSPEMKREREEKTFGPK